MRDTVQIICAAAIILAGAMARADIITTGQVEPGDPAAWVREPFPGTNAKIGVSGAGGLRIDGGSDVRSLRGVLGERSGGVGEVTVSGAGATWTEMDHFSVGQEGKGTLKIIDGGLVSNRSGYMGSRSGSTGIATVSGQGSNWAGMTHFTVGQDGRGELEITDGGSVSTTRGYINVGAASGSFGKVTISGQGSAMTDVGHLNVGQQGDGELEVTNGGSVSTNYGHFNLGSGTDSLGTAKITGQGSSVTDVGHLNIGSKGRGQLEITNGGSILTDRVNVHLAGMSGSFGSAIISGQGSRLTNVSHLTIGSQGEGRMEITNGGSVSTSHGYISIGSSSGSFGKLTVNGRGSSLTDIGHLNVGIGGEGVLEIADGVVISSRYGYLGRSSGAVGRVTISGQGSAWTDLNHFDVGGNGTGILRILKGGLVSAGDFMTIDRYGAGGSYIDMGSGGMLALKGSSAGSIQSFLESIDGSDEIRYFNEAAWSWEHITGAIRDEDYTLTYMNSGNLSGYTVLKVTTIPEPATMVILASCGLAAIGRRKYRRRR